MKHELGKAASFAVFVLLTNVVGLTLLFLVQYQPEISALISNFLLWTVIIACLITGPVLFLSGVIGTVIGDVYLAFTNELKPFSKAKLEAVIGKVTNKPIRDLGVTSKVKVQIYDATENRDFNDEDDRVKFSGRELMKKLRQGHHENHENLPEDLKAEVLESMMKEYMRKGGTPH